MQIQRLTDVNNLLRLLQTGAVFSVVRGQDRRAAALSRLHRDAGQPRYFVGCHCAPLSSRFLRMVGCLALVARYLPRLPDHGTGEVRQHARVLIKLTQAVGPTVKQTAQAVARVYANRPVIRDSELSLCDSTYCYPTTNSPAFPPNRSLAAASAPRSLRPRPGRSVCGTRFRGGRQGWGAACLKCGTPVCSLLALLPHTPPCPFPHPPVTHVLALRLSFSLGHRITDCIDIGAFVADSCLGVPKCQSVGPVLAITGVGYG